MTSAARVVDVRVLLDALRDAGLLVSSTLDLPPTVTDVAIELERIFIFSFWKLESVTARAPPPRAG